MGVYRYRIIGIDISEFTIIRGTMGMVFLFAVSKICMTQFGSTDTTSLPQGHSNETNICGELCEFDEWFRRARCEERALDKIPLPFGCQGVVMLELQGNNITRVDTESLQLAGYSNVRTLDFSSNEICELKPKSFVTTTNLKIILLSNNRLVEIQNGSFTGTENHLQKLYLNGNQIARLHSHAFSDLYAITYLNLDNNQLENVPSTVFRGLLNIQFIILRMNKLAQIASDTFKGLVKLKFLSLNYNKLSRLPNGLFTGLQSLEEVHLSHNALVNIPSPDSLGIHNAFQLFDLSYNNYTESGNIIPYLNISERFYFGGNPYICDCNFLLVQQWYNKSDTDKSRYGRTSPVFCHIDSVEYNIDDDIDSFFCETESSTVSPLYTSMSYASLTEEFKEVKKVPHVFIQGTQILDAVVKLSSELSSFNNDLKMLRITRMADNIFAVTVYCALVLTLFFVMWIAKSVHRIVRKRNVGLGVRMKLCSAC